MGEQAKKNFIINVIFISLWAGIIVIVGKFLFEYMFPFVISVAVAALMQKPAGILAKKTKIKKSIFATVFSAVLYVLLALVLGYAVLKIFSLSARAFTGISGLANSVLEVTERLKILISGFLKDIPVETQNAGEHIVSAMIENVTEKISSYFSETAAGIIKKAPSFLFSSVVALAATCYIAKDFDRLIKFFKNITNEKTVKTVKKITVILKTSVLKIVTGYLILMALTFVELCIGLAILGVERWLLIATFIVVVKYYKNEM